MPTGFEKLQNDEAIRKIAEGIMGDYYPLALMGDCRGPFAYVRISLWNILFGFKRRR